MRCALHSETETNLNCGKCGQPICPKCLIQTPVGARCPQCAALKRLPVYDVSAVSYVRATAAGILTASALGAVWAFIPLGGFFSLFLAMGVGYAVGEMVSLSVNRKRGLGLQVIAGVSMVASYIIRGLVDTKLVDFLDSLLSIYGLIALALGIIIAVGRLR